MVYVKLQYIKKKSNQIPIKLELIYFLPVFPFCSLFLILRSKIVAVITLLPNRLLPIPVFLTKKIV